MNESELLINRLTQQIQSYAKLQYVLAGLVVVALGFFYMAIYRPQTQAVDDLTRQIAVKQQQLESDRAQTNRLPAVTSELQRLTARLAGFKKLPPDPQLGEFMHEVYQASQQAQLHKLTDQPGEAERYDLYSEMPIELSFQGDFSSVYAFIHQIEDMQRLTRVRDVSIKTIDPTTGTVDVTLTVNIYYSENG
jgi:Tfp pilus assembly protein PilO